MEITVYWWEEPCHPESGPCGPEVCSGTVIADAHPDEIVVIRDDSGEEATIKRSWLLTADERGFLESEYSDPSYGYPAL